jgi:hypothetical protein
VLAFTAIRLRFFLLLQFESLTQLFLAAEEHYPFSQSLLVASFFQSEPPAPATLYMLRESLQVARSLTPHSAERPL